MLQGVDVQSYPLFLCLSFCLFFFSKIGAKIPLQKFSRMIISSFEIRLVCRIHSHTILVSQLLIGILNFAFSHFSFYCFHTILRFFFADR